MLIFAHLIRMIWRRFAPWGGDVGPIRESALAWQRNSVCASGIYTPESQRKTPDTKTNCQHPLHILCIYKRMLHSCKYLLLIPYSSLHIFWMGGGGIKLLKCVTFKMHFYFLTEFCVFFWSKLKILRFLSWLHNDWKGWEELQPSCAPPQVYV